MTPLRTLQTVTSSRPPTGRPRLQDVKNVGPESAKRAAVQTARWLTLLDIANRLTDAHLRATALDMLRHQSVRDVERFLWGLGK